MNQDMMRAFGLRPLKKRAGGHGNRKAAVVVTNPPGAKQDYPYLVLSFHEDCCRKLGKQILIFPYRNRLYFAPSIEADCNAYTLTRTKGENRARVQILFKRLEDAGIKNAANFVGERELGFSKELDLYYIETEMEDK